MSKNRQGWVVTHSGPTVGNGREWVTVPFSAYYRANLHSTEAAALEAAGVSGFAVFVTELEYPGVRGWCYAVTDWMTKQIYVAEVS